MIPLQMLRAVHTVLSHVLQLAQIFNKHLLIDHSEAKVVPLRLNLAIIRLNCERQ